MERAFEGRGDPAAWSEDLLLSIDNCFKANYLRDGVPCDSLFFPDHPENHDNFQKYCADVNIILRDNYSSALPYVREYFSYAMMWRKHGHRFPMPLGTATVIGVVHDLAKKYRLGLSEV
jgi:hypothetical protein